MPNQTAIRSREAILQTLLDDRDCDDDTALAIAGAGRKADVRWRRHGIYRAIRLREADATAWDIPASALRGKVDSGCIDEITAVTWAVMKYFDGDNEAAINKAGLADLPQWRNDGYAPMARAIWERAAALSADEATEWRDRLDRQMAMAVGKRSRRWIEKLVQQITCSAVCLAEKPWNLQAGYWRAVPRGAIPLWRRKRTMLAPSGKPDSRARSLPFSDETGEALVR